MPAQVEQLAWMAENHGDRVAYRRLDTGAQMTFAEWEVAASRLGRGLTKLGVRRGDRVALWLDGSHVLEWIVSYAAIHKAGAVAVPTNTRLTPDEVATVLAHAEPRVVITSAALADHLDTVRSRLPSIERIISAEPSRFCEAMAGDPSGYQVEVADDDLADIMYTSGTTGLPKGIAVRHGNLAILPNGPVEWNGNRWIHGSPLFTFAGISFVYNPMKMGMECLYMPRFDAGSWIGTVEQDRPTMAFLVPAMAQLIATHERFDAADLSSLEMVAIGSAPLPPTLHVRIARRLPEAMVTNNYSMTEAGTAFTLLPREEIERRPGSVGMPMGVEVRIADPEGNALPAGEIGEVLIHVGSSHREYYKDPEATAATWNGEWLRSGDLGRLDDDGYLYITGRAKDVIIRGGNNVHAADVESVLYQHPAVQEAAVAAVPHDVLGEDVGAWVVLRPDQQVDGAELIEFCRERLADYKCPRVVTFVAELPRNPTGKVLKRDLPPATHQPT